MANSSLPAEKDAGDSIGGRLVCRSDRRPAFPSVARAGSPASASGEELSRGGQGPEAPNELSLTAL